MKALAIILALCLVASTSQNQTNRLLQITTRTASVTKMCASFPDRSSLVDDKTKADAELNKAAMKASFKLSGNQLINSLLSSSDIMSAGLAQLPNMGSELGLFAGPFVLGLLIIILIWPFLCCCCCCPGCCPSKCCQKNQDQQYTKCELIWPAVVLILALLLMIVASVIGITRSSDIEQSYKAVGCSLAITFDDVVNGNTSTSGKYFIGMNGLYNTLTDLSTNLGTVDPNIQKLRISNTAQDLSLAYTEGTSTLTQISKIPSGSTAGAAMPSYNYPLNFDGTAGTIASTFPTLIGSTSGNSGAVSIAYNAFDQINEGLRLISDLADTFNTQLGSLPSTISQFKASMKDMVDLVNGFDTMISGMDSSISDIMKIVTLAVTAVFGVFIGLGVLSIIGTIFMTCCDKYSCRYLVYFVCVILFVLGIFCLLLSTLFSIITPVIYFGCDFLTVSISSSTTFSANLGKTLGAQLSSYLQVCLPGGSGDIINQMQGVDLSGVSSVSDAIVQMKSFDTTLLQTGSLATLTSLNDFIDKYYYTDVYDFSSTSNQDYIRDIATPSATGNSVCTANNFQSDKWVPSLRNTAFDCSGTTKTATYSATANTQCSSQARVQGGHTLDSTAAGCYGCMDSTKILMMFSSSNIGTRYAGCAWNTKLANLKTNYYDYKVTKYTPVRNQMAATLTKYNTATTGYNARLAAVGTTFTIIIGTLESSLNSIFDPQYGLMAGLNCLILGQDINLIANTACSKLFNTLFLLRLALGLSGFGILFALCCSTCSGVRAFKHMNKKQTVIPDVAGMGQQNSMNALNAKY